MTSLSNINSAAIVPYQHKVSAVARVAAVQLNLEAPLNPYAKQERARTEQKTSHQNQRERYSAQAAAPGFAAQILVESGLVGSDPFQGVRAARAYGPGPTKAGSVRLTA